MKIKPEQLNQNLKFGILPIYFIYGGEPFFTKELCDLIKKTANTNKFCDRVRIDIDSNFDVNYLHNLIYTKSIFSEKIFIELMILSEKINKNASDILEKYCNNTQEDKIILIIGSNLENSIQNSNLFKLIDKVGVIIKTHPINGINFKNWVTDRLHANGFYPDQASVDLLCEYTQGDLSAASQEIEKLSLIYENGSLNFEKIASSISNKTKFTVYDLVDAALIGNKINIYKILKNLQQEKFEITIILWAITKELRCLYEIIEIIENGKNIDYALHNIWEIRKKIIKNWIFPANILNDSNGFEKKSKILKTKKQLIVNLIKNCARIDRLIKGVEPFGNIWDELFRLLTKL